MALALHRLGSVTRTGVPVHAHFTEIVGSGKQLAAVDRPVRASSVVYVRAVHSLLPNSSNCPTKNAAVSGPVRVSVRRSATLVLFAVRDSVVQEFIRPIIGSNQVRANTPIDVSDE